jgi:xylulokinase
VLVAGVDSSTQSCKVVVCDIDDGAVVAAGVAPHPPVSPPRSEQDPAAWWAAFESAWAEAGSPAVAAVSVAGQQHGMVAVDSGGAPVHPAKLWNDVESAPQAAALVEELGAPAWAEACGSVPTASFTITKLAWLRASRPEAWARVARVLLPHDWLTWRLTRRAVTDRGDASGTGWWSPAEGRVRPDLLALVSYEGELPAVLAPEEVAGEWDGVAVACGTGDNMAAALGLALAPGDVAVSLGTSGTVFAVSERPTADASGLVAGFADATGRFLPLVCTLNCTRVTDWTASLLGVDRGGLEALAAGSSGGVVLVPHFDGERTPNRPDATGALTGLRSDVTREQVARAAFEGVVCNLLAGAAALDACEPGVAAGRVVLVGGGARSAAYRRIVADLTGRPVVVPDADELVARGAAVQAAAVLTGSTFDDVTDAWAMAATTVEPDAAVDGAAVRAAYAAAAERDQVLVDSPGTSAGSGGAGSSPTTGGSSSIPSV